MGGLQVGVSTVLPEHVSTAKRLTAKQAILQTQPRREMLPNYIDAETFAAFIESRRAHKAPFTPRAEKLLVMKLMRHHGEGWDVNEALEAATISGWKSIYPRVKRGQEDLALQRINENRALAVKPPPEIMAKLAALSLNRLRVSPTTQETPKA